MEVKSITFETTVCKELDQGRDGDYRAKWALEIAEMFGFEERITKRRGKHAAN